MSERLEKQIQFIKEIDKLKNIKRRSYITDASRRENDAEHSWRVLASHHTRIKQGQADGHEHDQRRTNQNKCGISCVHESLPFLL